MTDSPLTRHTEDGVDVPHRPDDRGSAEPQRRKRRDRPLFIVVTGHGKGKSTSAFGMLMRAWARDYRCGVFQFVKSGKWKVGEAKAAAALGGIDWEKMGDGWSWISRDLGESEALAREGWQEVKRAIAQERYEFLLLDEMTYPIKWGWIDVEHVVATISERPGFQHVVISGRDAAPELIDAADLVSEVVKVKHPMDEGIRAQQGIEVVDALVILDGASEPLGGTPTSLERARTPVLDELASEGVVTPRMTVAPGVPAGSETAIPGLLGWMPRAPVDRGAVEAAAYGIAVAHSERARRVDRRDRADAARTVRALAERLPRHRVCHLEGHRMLVVGPGPLPTFGAELLIWPGGLIPPRVLGEDTVLIGARGAAIGVARLMGARTIIPCGATGRPGTNLVAKAGAALAAIYGGARCVVVHVGAPDEAAHDHDAAAKVAAIEATDALLLGQLARAVRAVGGTLRVCPDHGCNPATGEHDGAPVPCLEWPAVRASGGRLTERAVAA